jgi:hypothetical protein
MSTSLEIDAIDRRILGIIQQDTTLSISDIGQQVVQSLFTDLEYENVPGLKESVSARDDRIKLQIK